MEDIQQDQSSVDFTTAYEANLTAWILVFGQLGRAYMDDPAGTKRSITDIPSAMFNSVMDAHLASEQVDAAIQMIVSDAQARNVPLLWWIGPSTRPTTLGAHLEHHGFMRDGESPGMAVELTSLCEPSVKPAGLSITFAHDETTWREWSITMMRGFGALSPNEQSVKPWCTILRQGTPGKTLAYTGWLDGKPVATALLFLAAGVAGIYFVTTMPEARRKGIGAHMTWHALQQARDMGYRIGVLEASEMGLGVYRSLGFQEYCRIATYLWQPPKI
jgi:GNAT superfamily N-acetyltransferase